MEKGFSLIELLIVITIIGIMSAFSIFQLAGHKGSYETEDQALKIINLMREAHQRAITQRQVMRLEINFSTRRISLIDEQTVEGTTTDPHTNDYLVRQDLLSPDLNLIRNPVGPSGLPDGITVAPDANLPAVNLTTSTHPLSNGNSVWAVRFRSNGTVIDTNASPAVANGTIYIWQPQPGAPNTPKNPALVRAVTLFGGTGAVRFWKYNGTSFIAS